MYTGELVLPNTNVVSDYRQAGGYGQVSATGFNDSYFPGAPTLSERADSNFITSLPQKIFSASIRNGILNCTGDDINLNANNGSIILTYIMPSDDGNNNSDPLCMPAGAVSLTDQNTVLANNGSRNSYGGLGVTQTYNALPVVTLGESAQTTSVESIPNDPNNVRVTVSENVIQEAYGMHFERRGDVERVLNGDYRAYFPDNGFYQEGKTYVINWVSNWIGQTSRTNCDNEGNCYTAWDGQVPGYCYDDICGSDPLKVNTGYPTPQIVQIASTAPTLVSSSVVRPRNSDILSVTQPQCRRWSDGNFWRTVQHV
jgi:hypothetical protein